MKREIKTINAFMVFIAPMALSLYGKVNPGENPFYCAKFANALAMLQIQKVGAVKSIPNRKNVEKLYGEIYG
jgi:sugar/nucleoside kinase (ribokinase family)